MIVDRERVAAALPGYVLGAELGSGTYGLVLAGLHRRLGRPVAIKIMGAGEPEAAPIDFAAEARVLAALDHPHIVRAYDYVEAEGLCLVVMELLSGGPLSRRRGPLPTEQACAVALAVAGALAHAHGRGVLHRDIKGGNILFAADGTVKVTDFGIAKLFEGSAVTASGVAGTPMYMAPEQIEGGRLGPATDLYSLGVVLYHLLTGSPPFDPTRPLQQIWHQHLTATPPPPFGVPTRITDVVLRALAKNPAQRQPNAQAFAVDLAAAVAHTRGAGWTRRGTFPLHMDDRTRLAAEPPPPPAAPPPQPPVAAPPDPSASHGPLRPQERAAASTIVAPVLLAAGFLAGWWTAGTSAAFSAALVTVLVIVQIAWFLLTTVVWLRRGGGPAPVRPWTRAVQAAGPARSRLVRMRGRAVAAIRAAWHRPAR